MERPATVLIGGQETGSRLAMVEVVERRGHALPRHRHDREDEVLYVLEGELAIWLDQEWWTLSAGSALLVSRGIEHTIAALTPEARVLTIVSPAGFEGFHRELAGPAARDVTLDRLAALAARFGCEITGPLPPLPDAAR